LPGSADPVVDGDRFSELVAMAREQARRDGLESAMPAYLEAIALDPEAMQASILRYQLALAWLERNETAFALDMLAAIIDRDPNDPLAGPLYRELLGEPAEIDVPAEVSAPTAVSPPAVAPADPLVVTGFVAGAVRILLDRDGAGWTLAIPGGAWDERGVLAVPAGWRGTLSALAKRRWTMLGGSDGAVLDLEIRDWRGHGILRRVKSGLILEIPLDEYLVGVVSTEMSSSWHIEALKAQAVASRTYVVRALMDVPAGRAWDVRGDVMDQAFRPTAIAGAAARAVRETAGEVLVWEGAPARIFFHADNGGISEDPRWVWGHVLPYYRVEKDPWSNKVPAWEARIGLAEWQRRQRLPDPRRVTLQRSASGRVAALVWEGKDGSRRSLRGNDVRLALGPRHIRSLLFDMERVGQEFVLRGRGYGHGVGMSQWGARTMADAGTPHHEILAHYYPGLRLGRLPAVAATR
jgi:SpoIID/LytB domain protein